MIHAHCARVRRLSTLAFAALVTMAAIAAGLGNAGCAPNRVSLTAGPREYVASDYQQVLKRWTRTESLVVLYDLDDKLTVTATFESYDFRWAYVVKYASDYRLTVEQRRELLAKSLRDTEDTHEFYIALYGTNRRWTDLTKQTSAWVVRLIDDLGNETAPRKIEFIEKPGAIERRYFPYTTVWRQVFRVRFPRTTPDGRPTIAPNARWFGLRFAGAEGNQELRWDLEASEAERTAAFGPGAYRARAQRDSHAREDLEQWWTRHE